MLQYVTHIRRRNVLRVFSAPAECHNTLVNMLHVRICEQVQNKDFNMLSLCPVLIYHLKNIFIYQ